MNDNVEYLDSLFFFENFLETCRVSILYYKRITNLFLFLERKFRKKW